MSLITLGKKKKRKLFLTFRLKSYEVKLSFKIHWQLRDITFLIPWDFFLLPLKRTTINEHRQSYIHLADVVYFAD